MSGVDDDSTFAASGVDDDSTFAASGVGVCSMLADHVFDVDSVMDGMLGVGSIGHTNIHIAATRKNDTSRTLALAALSLRRVDSCSRSLASAALYLRTVDSCSRSLRWFCLTS